MALTKESIFEAANELTSAGEQPTLAAIRKKLGGGSFTTISEAIKEWKAAKAPTIPIKQPAPDTITGKLADFGAELWAAALAMANDRLASERAATEAARVEIEAQRKEAADMADQLAAELDLERERAAGAAKDATAHTATLQGHLDEATKAKALAESDSRAKDARIKEMAVRIEDAKVTSERERATHSAAIGAEQARHEATRAKLQSAQTQLATTRAELAAATEKIQSAAAARASEQATSAAMSAAIQRQLDEAKAGEARERAAASTAREVAAKLSGQLAALTDTLKEAGFRGAASIPAPAPGNASQSA